MTMETLETTDTMDTTETMETTDGMDMPQPMPRTVDGWESAPTPDTPQPTNHVIVVGTLARERSGGRARRNAMGVITSTLLLELATPFGEPFSIPLTLAGAALDQYRQHAGRDVVAVEGRLRLEQTTDRRFADETEIFGRETDAMQIVVEQIRAATDDEQAGTSFACLEGTVEDYPVFRAHPTLPDLEYGLLTLAVLERRAPAFPGSRIVRRDRVLVRVAVPTTLPEAPLLYRPGNAVRVQGELDCVVVHGLPRNTEEQATVQRIAQEWQTAQAQYAPGSDEQRLAYRRYLGQRRNLEETARWRVLAGYVEGLNGAEPLSRIRAIRERLREQERRGARAVTLTPCGTAGVADTETVEEPPPAPPATVAPVRTRRGVRRAAAVSAGPAGAAADDEAPTPVVQATHAPADPSAAVTVSVTVADGAVDVAVAE